MVGLRVADFSIDAWRDGWVGFARKKSFYDSSATGELEGFAIGSSEGAVRFKVYDKVLQSAQIGALGFWRSVWGVEADTFPAVARFEWSIKAYAANFTTMGYLADFTFEGFLDVLNYVSLHWGRLCVPNLDDSNPSRWELSALWSEVRRLIDEWSFNYGGCAKREYDFSPDLNPTYLKSAAGWFAGLMARIGVHDGLETPVGVTAALQRLEAAGLSINEKAVEKRELFARLAGVRAHE